VTFKVCHQCTVEIVRVWGLLVAASYSFPTQVSQRVLVPRCAMALVPGTDASAADEVTLTLYLVLHKDDADTAMRVGVVPARHVTPRKPGLIGLRKDPEEARVRYMKLFGETNLANLVLFEFKFSSAGIARLSTQLTNAEHDFLPKLHKVKYEHQDKDWGVWHFVGDLPLKAPETMTWSSSRMEPTPGTPESLVGPKSHVGPKDKQEPTPGTPESLVGPTELAPPGTPESLTGQKPQGVSWPQPVTPPHVFSRMEETS